ncbi:class I SAM-dependent methyltransferase [Maribacter sp. 2307ULW6-5]|uniref:class I SAM-dependent methyltransferase n=1 Tax=Maribacter sp. 2307ULW6-5 TaxID=3386275 RepID=UPI0039BD5C62
MDILGKALLDHYHGRATEDIRTLSTLEHDDVLPLSHLFRSFDGMPILEQRALGLCRGTVLDVGCGAGSHSLWLQEQGLRVTALDRSAGAIAVCQLRGVQRTAHQTFLEHSAARYDTLLLLMNGLGIVGQLSQLDAYLAKMKTLLKPGGQILLDSSDLAYLYETDADGGLWVPGDRDYYGELGFTMAYQGEVSETFDWLYLDFNTLERAAAHHDLNCEKVQEGEHYDYLARLWCR